LSTAVRVTLLYNHTNLAQEVIAEIYGVSQRTISRMVIALTELIAEVTARFVPSFADLTAAATGKVVVVDGTLCPCWSWAGHHELWSGKHKTTGHNIQVVCDLDGHLLWMSDPYPGNVHDAKAFRNLRLDTILDPSNAIADKGYIGVGITTPIRKPAGGRLTGADEQWNAAIAAYRAVIEQKNAHIKTWRTLHTDYRRPLRSFPQTYAAIRGLMFFRDSFD